MVLTRKDIASLAAVSMVAMLSALDQTVVSTALPHILATLPGATLQTPLRTTHHEPTIQRVAAH